MADRSFSFSLQVMWLGYPGTSGAPYMDYIVTDKVTSPLHLAEQYSEKLAYMPHTFFMGDHRYMFPHLLFVGQGTTNPEAIRSIDSQSGVIRINGVIQKPIHPVTNQLTQQQVYVQPQLTQQHRLSQHQLHRAHAHLLQQQQQHSMLQVQHSLLSLQHQASHYFPNSQLATLQQIQQQNLLHQLKQQHTTLHPIHQTAPKTSQHQTIQQTPTSDVYTLPTDLPLTTRAQYGLPEDAVVYCNFNQLYKIDPATLENWVNILKQVPNSVLWLLRFPQAGEPNVIAAASRLGLPQNRIIFSPVAPKEEHVRRGRVADLCLDTPLCNGHTTGLDVLWAGTPVLTLPLETLASRVAASQLHALGFPELVASSREEYEEKAIQLGNNPRE